jgi:hypothetical protein
MAFPVILSTTITEVDADETAWDFNLPATIAAGDLLLLVAQGSESSGSAAYTVSGPGGGWVEKADNQMIDTRGVMGIFVKVADGSEDGGTVTITATQTAAHVGIVFRIQAGTWGGTTNDVEVSSWTTVEDVTTIDVAALTPSWGSADTMWLAAFGEDEIFGTPTPPASYGTNVEASALDTNETYVSVVRRENTTATENPGNFVAGSTDQMGTILIGVRPAGGGGGFEPDSGDWYLQTDDTDFWMLANDADWYAINAPDAAARVPYRRQLTTVRM